MILLRRRLLTLFALLAALSAVVPRLGASAQAPDPQDRDRAHRMLGYIRDDLKRYYYDSTFGGIDLAARFAATDSAIDRAPTIQSMFGAIAQVLFELNDSHTSFVPPRRAANVQYGWDWDFVGDRCYVSHVTPGSDAAAKGLALGDQVHSIDGLVPNRASRWLIGYLYYSLNPRPGMRVIVEKPDGTRQELDILAKVTPAIRVEDQTNAFERSRMYERSMAGLRAVRHRTKSFGDSVLIWRMRAFIGNDQESIDVIMDAARQHRSLVLDLRDNGGGSVATELRLLGHFFSQKTRVLTVRTRDKREPRFATPVGREPFSGTVVILVNSNSASASEITSRVLQLEGKATIVGDRSAGAVMTSIYRSRAVGFTKVLPFGLSVTVADVIMEDGNRLENVGVTPEFIVLPTGADLAARRDPQMAKALALVGVTRSPEAAARIFEDP